MQRRQAVLIEIMEHFELERGFKRTGFIEGYETKQSAKLLKEIKSSIRQGNLTIVSGIMGSGKTTTVKMVKETLTREKEFVVCKSLSLDKHKINLNSLMTALFIDLDSEKGVKIPTQQEKRERTLCELITKKQKPVVLFVDEAHDLSPHTLKGLKKLVETVQENSKGCLSIVLIGHPRLKNTLRKPSMEEIGARSDVFTLEVMDNEEKVPYIRWLLNKCKKKSSKLKDIIDDAAINYLAAKVATPLQIEQTLELAFEYAYAAGQKPVDSDVIESVIAKDLNDIEPTLARLGYSPKIVAEVLNIRPGEVKKFLKGRLTVNRTDDLRKQLLASGIPL